MTTVGVHNVANTYVYIILATNCACAHMFYMFIPEKSNNELQHKHSHGDKAQPRMHAVEIHFRRLRQIVRIEDGQKSQSHTRYGAGVKEHMNQLNIDVLQATA